MEPLIRVRRLTARAGSTTLLDEVGLTVDHGGVTALVGPSGSGKTTTALALLGETAPGVLVRGEVTVAGVRVVDGNGVTADADAVRGATVAYLPQHPGAALNPARRIGSVLTELARLHRDSHNVGRPGRAAAGAAAADALQAAGLPGDREHLRRFPHRFSGGQRQRVALAQVMACAPRVLVLDEPSTGLDTVARLRLLQRLEALAADGIGMLLLSHDLDLVQALADRTVLLERGRVTAEGPTREVLRAPTGGPPPVPRGNTPASTAPAAGIGALEVRSLTAWLRPARRNRVLHDVGLSVQRGGCVAVAGPSGSGKTTLARCIAGLHERYEGAVLLDGGSLPVLRHRDREQTRRVQYVWQETRASFDERRPILDQVARTAVRLRGLTQNRAADEAASLLDRLDVAEEKARRRASTLSGGELQRAALARAMLALPEVLVCDEVTTALDEAGAQLVLDEIDRMRRTQGTAVLLISHDLALAEERAGELLLLDAGRVVERGDSRSVLARPQSATTQLLVRARALRAAAEPTAPNGPWLPPDRRSPVVDPARSPEPPIGPNPPSKGRSAHMTPNDAPVWQEWQESWDRQQEWYMPDREERFRVMLDTVEALAGTEPVVLDLACGTGSITDRLLRRLPGARSTGVDVDPALLTIADGHFAEETRVTFVTADITDPGWTRKLPHPTYDAVVTATALHWLGAGPLPRLYGDLAGVLREGGVFLNADHMTDESAPLINAAVDDLRAARREQERRRGALDWADWWSRVADDPLLADSAVRRFALLGDPRRPSPRASRRDRPVGWHIEALREQGFREARQVWCSTSDALVAALR